VDGVMPDVTVYLALDHREGLKRRFSASEPDRLEMETVSFHARVQQAYETLIAQDPQRFVLVDASQSIEKVAQDALEKVLERLEG